MKKIMIFTLAIVMLVLASCQTDSTVGSDTTNAMTTVDAVETTEPNETDTQAPPEEEGPKGDPAYQVSVNTSPTAEGFTFLGVRRDTNAAQLKLLWSGSGLEYTFDCKGGSVTFRVSTSNTCSFRIYLDGKVLKNTDGSEYYTVKGVRNLETPYIEAGEHTVRLIRVSDSSVGNAAVFSTTFFGTLQKDKAVASKSLFVDFIGSAVATGAGLGKDGSEDASLAYPYLTAVALNADYNITTSLDASLLVNSPDFGSTYAADYDFARKPDVVVVDLGAEDFVKNGTAGVDAASFEAAFSSFLKLVRQKNGNTCKIICVYNAVNDGYADQIKRVAADMGGENAGYFTLSLTRAAGTTPTAAEQQAYADALKAKIEAIKDLTVTLSGIVAESSGDGDKLDYSSVGWNS